MKSAYSMVVIGSIFISIPLTVISFWPAAHSQKMPDDISRYTNSYYAPLSPRISSWGDARLKRIDNEGEMEYSQRMLSTVHNATYHCEAHNYYQSWFTWLSYQLGIYSLMPGNNHGVLDIKTFRCGFCHQRAYILATALRNGGIDSARVLGLNGHVITVFNINQDLYSLDPDFGVGPVKITGIDSADSKQDPQTAQRLWDAYNPFTQAWSDDFIKKIIGMYISQDDNEYYNIKNLDRLRIYQSILFSFEKLIEYLLYIMGFSLISLGIFMRLKNIRNTRELKQHFKLATMNNTSIIAKNTE